MTAPAAGGDPLRGILSIVAGCAFLTLSDGIMKGLVHEYPVGQLLFVRAALAIVPLLVLAYLMGGLHLLKVRRWRPQLIRGAVTAASAFGFIFSLRFLPLADALAITFASPLIVTLLAPRMLGEQVGVRRLSAVAVGFFGVLLMFRPGSDAIRWIALIPLGVACVEGVRDIYTRRMTRTETSLAILATTSCVVGLGGLLTCAFAWQPMSATVVAATGGSAVLFTLAHYFLIEGFRHGEASLVVPFKYSSLLFSLIVGYVVWSDVPDPWMIAGCTLIIGSGLYILHREGIRRETPQASAKSS